MATAAPDVDRLCRENLRLVTHIAKNYHSPLGLDELIGYGNEGLVRAARRFDPRRGVKFSTYACHWIKAYIRRAIQRESGVDKTLSGRRLFWGLRRALKDGCTTNEEIAEYVGIDIETVKLFAPHLMRGMVRLDRTLSGGDALGDFFASNNETPEELVADKRDRDAGHDALIRALETLPPRERFIIEQRFLVDGQRLCDVGAALGLTRERVRQLQDRALKKLQIRMGA